MKMSSAVQEQMQQQLQSLASYMSSPLVNPGGRKVLNSELWHACAGPLVTLPQPGSLVYYFPQGHSEQVTASTRKTANSHIPNHPNLPSQLLCQVYNVTLHADKDTDEIYAQMTLQPVNSEYDAVPVPDFEHTKCKQPNDFFCKNLTASDTSTHGGFSVPRRSAEKLFPQLDYSMQPPNQELIVRDLHDNLWTFRHIYRGQPRRHLLTTGWSLFVGTKRLKAGDSVLFIRDEKSQLLLGVRRANRQQTALPSSVLSADSMHIGVLAAAAHAAASRSSFTVYYNPRACPSEFIIPLAKYHKAVYTQVSIGMRFGMMFETEESTKRRYMGTIIGISDLDPVRWPNSKWRNLQVGWDEHGYGERPDRVSLWEIDTPESLFVFPTPNLKRQCLPGFVVPGAQIGFTNAKSLSHAPENGIGNLGSEQLLRMLLTPQIPRRDQLGCDQSIDASVLHRLGGSSVSRTFASASPAFGVARGLLQPDEQSVVKQVVQQNQLPLGTQQFPLLQNSSLQNHPVLDTSDAIAKPQDLIIAEDPSADHCQDHNKDPKSANLADEKSVITHASTMNQIQESAAIQDQVLQIKGKDDPQVVQPQLEASASQSTRQETSCQLDNNGLASLPSHQSSYLSEYSDNEDWMSHQLCYQSFNTTPKVLQDPFLLSASDYVDSPLLDLETVNAFDAFQFSCISDQRTPQFLPSCIQELSSTPELNSIHDVVDHSETYSNLQFEASNGNTFTSPCVSSTVLEGFGIHSEDLFSTFTSNLDIQSQVTSASLADCRPLSVQDIPDMSVGTSSGTMDINECSFLDRRSKKQAGKQHLRTYTKVQKIGSVGRSIDVTRFKNYNELVSAIACMFGLEGQLDDYRGSEWKLVYVDYENDVLLVGDDPWEEFVQCVRCIRILSPSEVQQMSEGGVQLTKQPSCSMPPS